MEQWESFQREVCGSVLEGISLNSVMDNRVSPQSVQEVLELQSLQVVFQPIVDHLQGRIYGHEVLSRPMLKDRLIRPDLWFRTAYETRRSLEADMLVLTTAVESLQALSQDGASMPMFVNVMPSSLLDKSFLTRLRVLFEQGLCRPENLVFELVEYVPYQPASLVNIVATLRALGVRLALDDVGNGGSLAAMVELEPDFIKLDRSLIQGIAWSKPKQKLLSYFVDYMGSGYRTVVEGVENPEDLSVVKAAGATLSQGYLWSHPLPAEQYPGLRAAIEICRNELIDLVALKELPLTATVVVEKSQAVDALIEKYCRLAKGKQFPETRTVCAQSAG
ncbi:EAL domain-containing protein [Alicyclobacillaceae bacterium I2511]|nr:EAL domain-containing protein [Alicyclobacillaceae bacterium I2511]